MKGYIIFENFDKLIDCKEILDGDYTCMISDYPNGTFSGVINRATEARCNKEDTYDFETGALIALMKMCGFDKSYKAIEEAFKYNSYDAKKNKELNILKRDNDKVKDLDVKEYYNKLSEENINLKKEKEQIIVAKNILYNNLEKENEKLKKRINELESYNAKLEERIAAEQRGGYKFLKDMEKLQHEYDLCKNSENALKCSVDYLNKSIAKLNTAIYGYKQDLNKVAERCKELEEENEKLKLDCEKLQHGYNDMIFCGEQINKFTVDSLIEESRAFTRKCIDEWLYKVPTKREEMWENILACGDCEHSKYVKVKKKDLEMFAKECNKKKIFSIIGCEFNPQTYWSDDDSYIFQIFRKPAGFICAKMVVFVYKDTIIDYLPPMRWDLFKKGRIVVGVRKEHYDEFILNATEHIDSFNKHNPYDDFNYSFFIYNKDSKFIEAIGRSQFRQLKVINNHKVVYWEDVK